MQSKLKPGINDLLTQRPDLAAEWHPDKNGALTPRDVCVFSTKSAWWQIKVQRFGKEFTLEWEALISNRANGAGCPYLSNPPKKLRRGFNDLQSTNPSLVRKWHPTKNGTVKPDMVFENTDTHFWWFHNVQKWGREFVHEWRASPKTVKRGGKDGGCPICHGTQVLPGYNDLYTCYPALAAQWDYTKNTSLGLDPKQITCGSNRSAYWICDNCGHTWKAMILNRTARNTQCPKCAKRSQTSFPEQALFFYFKRRFKNCLNRDKTALGKGELDLYLPDEKFAVEYCGLLSHASQARKAMDAKKQELCEEKGIRLIRVYEHESENRCFPKQHIIYCVPKPDYSHLYYVMQCLNAELIGLGLICKPIAIDIKTDEGAIRAQYQQSRIGNDLATTHADLLAEWDYEGNGTLKPQGFSAGSGAVVCWKHIAVKNGKQYVHRWRAKISKRTRGTGCPICAGKIVQKGYNDLASDNPSFLTDWDDERNEISPQQVTSHSSKKIWWKHDTIFKGKHISHVWRASVKERMQGNGCAICAGKIVQKGINDLTITHPELLSEWDDIKNHLRPDSISYGYDQKVWWKHTVANGDKSIEHSWNASPNSRTNRKSGCPYCANKKVLSGYNDLSTKLPEVAQKWDFERNGLLKPHQVTIASSKRVYWIDKEKPVRISDRIKYLRLRDRTAEEND